MSQQQVVQLTGDTRLVGGDQLLDVERVPIGARHQGGELIAVEGAARPSEGELPHVVGGEPAEVDEHGPRAADELPQ